MADRTGPVEAPSPPRVGIWALVDLPRLGDLLSARVLEHQLGRRLPWVALERGAPYGWALPHPRDGGHLAHPLVPRPPVAAAVVTGTIPSRSAAAGWYRAGGADVDDGDLGERLAALGDAATVVAWTGVTVAAGDGGARLGPPPGALLSTTDGPSAEAIRAGSAASTGSAGGDATVVPHPALLAARLVAPTVLERRQRFLRAIGELADGAPVVVATRSAGDGPAGPGRRGRFARRARRAQGDLAGRATVLFHPDRPTPAADGEGTERWLDARLGVEDLLAVLAGAAAVVADDAAVAAAAVALGRPVVLFGEDPATARLADDLGVALRRDPATASRDAVRGRARTPGEARLARLRASLDEHHDGLADHLRDHLGRTEVGIAAAPARLRDEELGALRLAHDARGARLAAERTAFVGVLHRRVEEAAARARAEPRPGRVTRARAAGGHVVGAVRRRLGSRASSEGGPRP